MTYVRLSLRTTIKDGGSRQGRNELTRERPPSEESPLCSAGSGRLLDREPRGPRTRGIPRAHQVGGPTVEVPERAVAQTRRGCLTARRAPRPHPRRRPDTVASTWPRPARHP